MTLRRANALRPLSPGSPCTRSSSQGPFTALAPAQRAPSAVSLRPSPAPGTPPPPPPARPAQAVRLTVRSRCLQEESTHLRFFFTAFKEACPFTCNGDECLSCVCPLPLTRIPFCLLKKVLVFCTWHPPLSSTLGSALGGGCEPEQETRGERLAAAGQGRSGGGTCGESAESAAPVPQERSTELSQPLPARSPLVAGSSHFFNASPQFGILYKTS